MRRSAATDVARVPHGESPQEVSDWNTKTRRLVRCYQNRQRRPGAGGADGDLRAMKLWRGTLLFLIGLALGAVLAGIGPRVAGPYLPDALRGKVESVEGEVTRKQREPDRLLFTVVTPRGAILAIFRKRIPEVDLLVAEGDVLTLGLRRFEPFVEDPAIQSVKKKAPAENPSTGAAGRTR